MGVNALDAIGADVTGVVKGAGGLAKNVLGFLGG
jgi:hypothetical protein